MKSVLVVGGAGYIGSVTSALLLERGWEVVIVDDLSTGHLDAVPPGARLARVDIRDRAAIAGVVSTLRPECALHFAARTLVGESFPKAHEYFDVNVGGTASLLSALVANGCSRIVFSSSCTVYGTPDSVPIDETAQIKPAISPYGQTKQMNETTLEWLRQHNGLSYSSLRYFNAAGAWQGRGEDHRPESHLIPLCIDAALGLRGELKLFGTDYPTPDGTCIRDYIHIRDLADAHVAACDWLLSNPQASSLICNLGTGTGSSNLDVIKTVQRISGKTVPYTAVERRPGDPPALVASNVKARQVLGWNPTHSDLSEIVETAFEWRAAHPSGYRA